MFKFMLFLTLISCGNREAYIGSRNLESSSSSISQQSCNPPRELYYLGVLCINSNQNQGNLIRYNCANGRYILVDCQGTIH